VCAAALGLYQLGEPSLWIDEAFTARAMSDEAPPLSRELHVVYYAVLRPWTDVFGTSEMALRLPSVIGAVVAVVLLYGLTRRLFDERVAFVASLLLAVNPFAVKWSQQARSYSILLALAIGSTWLLLWALERRRARAFALYALVTVTMISWQPFSALLLLPVHAFIARRDRRGLLWISEAALASVPWIVRTKTVDDLHEFGDPGTPLTWLPAPSFSAVAEAAISVPGALGVGVVIAALGVWRLEEHRSLLLVWAGLPWLLALAISLVQPAFLDRYLIVSCPAFAILGAVALVRGVNLRRWTVPATAVATGIGLMLWYAPSGGDNWLGENWRAATELVMQEGGGAQVTPTWARTAFHYYGGREGETGLIVVRQRTTGEPVYAKFGEWLHVLKTAPR